MLYLKKIVTKIGRVSFVVPRDNIVELTEFFYCELRINDSRIRTGRAMQILGVHNVDGKELLITQLV